MRRYVIAGGFEGARHALFVRPRYPDVDDPLYITPHHHIEAVEWEPIRVLLAQARLFCPSDLAARIARVLQDSDRGTSPPTRKEPMSEKPPDQTERVTVELTREEARIILSLTGPRAASPDARRYGDWSVELDRKLRAALTESTPR